MTKTVSTAAIVVTAPLPARHNQAVDLELAVAVLTETGGFRATTVCLNAGPSGARHLSRGVVSPESNHRREEVKDVVRPV